MKTLLIVIAAIFMAFNSAFAQRSTSELPIMSGEDVYAHLTSRKPFKFCSDVWVLRQNEAGQLDTVQHFTSHLPAPLFTIGKATDFDVTEGGVRIVEVYKRRSDGRIVEYESVVPMTFHLRDLTKGSDVAHVR